MNKEMVRIMHEVSKLTRDERHSILIKLEKYIDSKLYLGLIDQETAWDLYFGLLHECDESIFLEDRPRILEKIGTEKYNPLNSKNPDVVMLARIRLGSGEEPNKKEILN